MSDIDIQEIKGGAEAGLTEAELTTEAGISDKGNCKAAEAGIQVLDVHDAYDMHEIKGGGFTGALKNKVNAAKNKVDAKASAVKANVNAKGAAFTKFITPEKPEYREYQKGQYKENALIMAGNAGKHIWFEIKSIPLYIVKFGAFLKAIVIIALVLIVLYIVFYLIYYYHPQFFFICHWTGFNTYMSRFYDDFKKHVKHINTFALSGAAQHAYKALAGYDIVSELAEIKGLLAGKSGVASLSDEELSYVFRFWNSLKNVKGSLQKMDLALIGDDKYLEDGEVNPDNKAIKDLEAKAKKVRELRDKIGKVRSSIDTKEMASVASGVMGSLNPFKLFWMKLMIENKTKQDTTLQHLVDTMGHLDPNENVWAMHIQMSPPCDKRPLTSNERIYLEIKRFLSKCGNPQGVLNFIDSVLDAPPPVIPKPEDQSTPEPSSGLVSAFPVSSPSTIIAPRLKPGAYAETRAIFDAIMAVYELDLMLNTYLYDIRLGYETRKSGYRMNFVIWTYYWWPYAQWLFVIKIGKQTWGKFPKNFKDSVLSFLEWWITLPEALLKLPMTLAGEKPKERFEQPGDSNYPLFNYMNNIIEPFIPKHISRQLKPDTVEHFGFLKGLLSIGKFFMGILMVVTKLIFMITQPVKFLMMLIGFVVALGLMIVYILITVIGLHYVLAGIWAVITVLMVALFFTVFYTLMLIPTSMLYVILWVLDMALGGLIMALMRCENIPSKWYSYSAYANGNTFQRALMCSYRCADRYEPDTAFVFSFCKRVESIKPTFCPHQNLFKLYKGESLSSPATFQDFEVNMTTANMNQDQRVQYLEKVLKVRTAFNETCRECYSNDVRFNDNNALQSSGQDYTHIPRIMCKYAAQVCEKEDGDKGEEEGDGEYAKKYQQVCELCDSMYGTDVPMYRGDFKFSLNNTGDAMSQMFEADAIDDPTRDPYIKGLSMFVACIIAIAVVVYIIHAHGSLTFGP